MERVEKLMEVRERKGQVGCPIKANREHPFLANGECKAMYCVEMFCRVFFLLELLHTRLCTRVFVCMLSHEPVHPCNVELYYCYWCV